MSPTTNVQEDRRSSGLASAEERHLRIKKDLHQKLISEMDLSTIGSLSESEIRDEIRRGAEQLCLRHDDLLSLTEREQLIEEVLDETFGIGPLEGLMRDPTVSDILVNGPKVVYVERGGRLTKTDVVFNDEKHLVEIVRRIVGRVGRRIDETSPLCDARLADGSRVNAVIPPLALDGTLLSIRRAGKSPLLTQDLIEKRAITQEMVDFLAACIKGRVNMVISGGTGSGKTTLLNALSAFIPEDERVATIEDAAELRLQQPHVVRMETRPPNIEGEGAIGTRELVKNALRMRPDRIVVGECRGSETLDMLQAMNTGHDGSMTTIHANDTRDAIGRMEMMVGMAGFDLPIWIIRRQIASAVQIIVQAARLSGGVRRIIKISEIVGMEEEVVSMHDLFVFKQTGVDGTRAAQGYHYCTGVRPKCLERLEEAGLGLAPELFESRILTSRPQAEPPSDAEEPRNGDRLWGLFGRGKGEGTP
ncbi:CpaF family protein [Paludisphaera mucosa]|uniref:CpaF family protein n=1 Tax=Paludisphaera mucosa TaxID=3030827 RepID=A0ABT6FAX9_9BACT|nr:CpaF family protein [Paludisphaera mucosa]MDG3004747.1 CpaF family protein [Paludisphaera mucosa]